MTITYAGVNDIGESIYELDIDKAEKILLTLEEINEIVDFARENQGFEINYEMRKLAKQFKWFINKYI